MNIRTAERLQRQWMLQEEVAQDEELDGLRELLARDAYLFGAARHEAPHDPSNPVMRRAARHEAAHAVALAVLGFTLGGAWVRSGGWGRAYSSGHDDPRVPAAGPAQCRLDGHEDWFRGTGSDFGSALRLGWRAGGSIGPSRAYQQALDGATAILRRWQPEVGAVARVLLREGAISGPDALKLLVRPAN